MGNIADNIDGSNSDKQPQAAWPFAPLPTLHQRLSLIQWLTPLVMIILVVIYEASSGRWIQSQWGSGIHLIVEILFFGFLGPTLAFVLIHFLRRWLEEKETSEYQTQLLEQVQKRIISSQDATDDAIQAIFAASILLVSLERKYSDFSEEDKALIGQTQLSLDKTVRILRGFLNAESY